MASQVRWTGWAAFALPVLVLFGVPAAWPRWLFMWLLAAAIYFACKVLTWSAEGTNRVAARRQWAYVLAWPGMNAARFFATKEAQRPSPSEWLAGATNLIAGGIVFWNARHWIEPSSTVLLGWAGMVGTILMLHFGSFHLLSCLWRSVGVDAPPLMNRPLRSTSVSEFWGRRWNTAFRDLTYQFLFRPLARRTGPTKALLLGFFISGVIHDLVISVPARGGYGGPTAFFCLQAVAMLAERSAVGTSWGLGRGWRGWLFTALVLLLPARLLFHDPFVIRIAVPFMRALGAA